jgi:hypothetical protein
MALQAKQRAKAVVVDLRKDLDKTENMINQIITKEDAHDNIIADGKRLEV